MISYTFGKPQTGKSYKAIEEIVKDPYPVKRKEESSKKFSDRLWEYMVFNYPDRIMSEDALNYPPCD